MRPFTALLGLVLLLALLGSPPVTAFAASPPPAANNAKPASAPPQNLDAPTLAVPAGTSQCPSTATKESSPGASCRTATPAAPPAVAPGKVSLPQGAQKCPSIGSKRSSATATCSGFGAAATQAPTSRLPVRSANLAGYSISLYGSTNALPPGYTLSLSAYANLDVGPTPYWIEIYDQSTGGLVARCGTGSACYGSVAEPGATTHSFIAYIAGYGNSNPPPSIAATSNAVSCTWLAISLYASPQYTAAGRTVTLTAYTNTDVGPTPYWIEIFDASTGANLAICARGSSCSGSTTQYGATVHSFTAYVSGYGTTNPPPSAQVSAGTYAVWFGISLYASSSALAPGGTTTLTTYTNADVGPSPYWTEIYDQTTGGRVATCATGTVCQVNITQAGSTIRDYVAYVAGLGATNAPPSVQATSNGVRVTWISVTLGATVRFLAPGASTTLVANASLDVGPTPYLIQVYDQSARTLVFQCATGTSCTGTTSQSVATTHSFVAYVNGYTTTYPPPAPRAASAPVSVTWLSVSLREDRAYALANSPVTLVATANADITYAPYSFEIYDQGSTQNVKECRTGSTCTVAITQPSAGTHTYIAYLATTNTAWPPQNVQATSNTVTAMWVADCAPSNSCNPTTFADNIFVYPGIGAPVTASNEYAMRVWERREGGGAGCPGQAPNTAPWAYSAGPAGNPINTTQPEPGSTRWNSVGVQIFHDYGGQTCWHWGITANGDTLLNGYYPGILAVLRSPVADNYQQCVRLAQAVGNSPWGTGNFQSSC